MKSPYPERNAKIIALRKAGVFPFEIADRLNLTRNAVIGVCNRAGLSGPGSDRTEACRAKFGKLCPDSVSDIRCRRAKGESATTIALDFRISPHTVYAVARRATWADVA